MTVNDQSVLAKLAFNGYHVIFEQLGFLTEMRFSDIEDARKVGTILGTEFPSVQNLVDYYHANNCKVKNIRDNRGVLLWPNDDDIN